MTEAFDIGKALDISTLSDDVASLRDDLRDLTEGARGALIEQVETRPIASLLAAAGVGFLASLLFRTARTPRVVVGRSRPRTARRGRRGG